MRFSSAACCLYSAVFLLILLLTMPRAAVAVMPPSTSLEPAADQKTETTEYASTPADSDVAQQILAQVRANHQLLEKIEQEEDAIAARLQNYSTHTSLQVTRS